MRVDDFISELTRLLAQLLLSLFNVLYQFCINSFDYVCYIDIRITLKLICEAGD